jgi:hypothetical protein
MMKPSHHFAEAVPMRIRTIPVREVQMQMEKTRQAQNAQ